MVVVACRKTVWAYDAKTPLPISPPLANEDTSSSSNRRAPGQANSSLPSRLETSRSTASRGLKALACRYRSEEHTSELQSLRHLVCRLLLEKKNSKLAFSTEPTS